MTRPAEVTIAVSTSSQPIPGTPPLPNAQVPQITLNDTLIPRATGPTDDYPTGVQVVVMNASGDLSDPANFITNSLNIVWGDVQGGWSDTYRYMWDNVANQIYGAGDPQQQVVIIATYGMDLGMFPTPDVVELFLSLGAGPQLQNWINTASPSESGGWVDYPADYVLIGSSSLGYGLGTEQFDFGGGEENPVKTNVSVTLQNNPEPPTATR
ncbi:MAG: hypothetical protein QOC77_2959 [Thermoleophilaceae bacterium]|nr:hypothetical protein [Thermoleophilaceae bacterium]